MVAAIRPSDPSWSPFPSWYMRRFADLFIAFCIPVVAVSSGIAAYYQFEATPRVAAIVAASVLVGLIVLRVEGLRRRGQRDLDAKFVAMARRLTEFGGDLTAIERRLAALEDGGSRRTRDDIDQLVAEVEVIGTLTRQVIETVADLEMSIAEGRVAPGRAGPAVDAATASSASRGRGPRAAGASPLVPERFAHLDADGFLAVVRAAVDAERLDLHLQPIVTLPQRKVRFYECLTRLRTEDGETIHPSDYIPLAEARGFVAALDEQILLKSVQILRRLASRSKEIGIFLNLSPASLADASFFEEFVQVLEANRDLHEMLVLEFPQGAVRDIGPLERESLRLLRELGFRFSIDQVADLKTSFQNLADLGFRYVKVSADRLLSRGGDLGTDIHPVDLADYFQRFGMELIADHIEREADVVDVLDFGVKFGQGFLFAPPRPVRADLLQSAAESRAAVRAASAAASARAEPSPPPPAAERPAPTRPAARPLPRPVAAAAPADAEAPRPGIRIVPGTAAR